MYNHTMFCLFVRAHCSDNSSDLTPIVHPHGVTWPEGGGGFLLYLNTPPVLLVTCDTAIFILFLTLWHVNKNLRLSENLGKNVSNWLKWVGQI